MPKATFTETTRWDGAAVITGSMSARGEQAVCVAAISKSWRGHEHWCVDGGGWYRSKESARTHIEIWMEDWLKHKLLYLVADKVYKRAERDLLPHWRGR